VPAGRAVEPILAILALRFGKPLFLLALGTLPIHLPGLHILLEEQTATRTDLYPRLTDFSTATRRWAMKYRLARLAPVLAFLFFFAYRTLFHKTSLLPFPNNTNAGTS